jgi:hypothetical protein
MIDNRFLKTDSKSSSTSVIEELIIGVAAMGTGESVTGSAITLSCAMDVTATGTEKNGSATIGVGTQTRFFSSHISRGTVLPLITSSSRETACLISTILMYLSGP